MTGDQGRVARWVQLLACLAMSLVLAAPTAPLQANQPAKAERFDRISLPYACRVEHGRVRLEPSPEQIYHLNGRHEQQLFKICRERSSCQTLMLHRFSITCSGQHVAWADIVTALADRGHLDRGGTERARSKLSVADGRLGFSTVLRPPASAPPSPPNPPGQMLTGWCSDQFGAPSQPFLRQACNEARRFVANLGGATQRAPRSAEPAAPQFVSLPRGFAPVRSVGARLLVPSAPGLPPMAHPEPLPSAPSLQNDIVTGAISTAIPSPTAQEPNDRIAALAAAFPPRPAAAPAASTWITSVHLASATVAASSQATAERQRNDGSAMFMLAFTAILVTIAGVAVAHRYRQSRTAVSAAPTTLLRLPAPAGHSTSPVPSPVLPSQWPSLRKSLLPGLRRQLESIQAARWRHVPIARTPQTPEELAALAALPAEARLIITARDQLVDRIDQLRQAIDPLIRTAPALHMALARDLMAGERRLAKLTVVGLADDPAAPAPWKPAQTRLQRVSADIDRLQEIIAGAVASFARMNSPRQLPRDLPEAYATLGVNPGVSEGTVKKLVDALRVSWHPDLATSPEDRQLRDERIKEINVAWDLIAGRRAVG